MLLLCMAWMFAFGQSQQLHANARIVSASGTLSEILCELGFEKNIVGVDVTTTYPKSLTKLPKISSNRTISTEGILALRPTLVVALRDQMPDRVEQQLRAAGVQVRVYEQEYSLEGTLRLIRQLATDFGKQAQGEALAKQVSREVAALSKYKYTTRPRVLFIYARGAGTLLVAGKQTSVAHAIEMAGGQNAIDDFEGFKPLTAEALLQSNPEVILMFSGSLSSLGGANALLQIQGMSQTIAGRNRKFVEMDGQLLTGFGPRLGKALQELSAKIH